MLLSLLVMTLALNGVAGRNDPAFRDTRQKSDAVTIDAVAVVAQSRCAMNVPYVWESVDVLLTIRNQSDSPVVFGRGSITVSSALVAASAEALKKKEYEFGLEWDLPLVDARPRSTDTFREVRKLLLEPRRQFTGAEQLVRDLRIDGDDLSFLFAPAIEARCATRPTLEDWRRVGTIDQAVDRLMAPLGAFTFFGPPRRSRPS